MKKNYFFMLLWLFFLALMSTQTGMDVFASLIVLGTLWNIRKDFESFDQLKVFLYLGLAFFVNIALGFLVNGQMNLYFLQRLQEALWPLVTLGVYYFLTKVKWEWGQLKYFLWPLRAVTLIPLIIFIISSGKYFVEKDGVRFGGSFSEPMTYAHSFGIFTVLLVMLTLGALIYRREKVLSDRERALLIAATLICGFSVVMTFTRGVWLGMFVAVLASSIYYSKRVFLGLTVAGVAGFLGLFFAWEKFRERILFTFNFEKTYDSERMALWKSNIAIALDHPIFGTGWGLNKHLLLEYYQKLGIQGIDFQSHAHNQFLHLWAGTGTVGLIIYLAFFGLAFRMLHRLIQHHEGMLKAFFIGIFAVNLEFLVSGLTESNFERSRVRYLVLISWAIALYAYKKAFVDIRKT